MTVSHASDSFVLTGQLSVFISFLLIMAKFVMTKTNWRNLWNASDCGYFCHCI